MNGSNCNANKITQFQKEAIAHIIKGIVLIIKSALERFMKAF
ncbi:hypothetical protein L930_01475 [Helicobacter pylori PZ5004]|nr:hypothetical protein L930_01475 [Helicobacter pylori PZ5004]